MRMYILCARKQDTILHRDSQARNINILHSKVFENSFDMYGNV